mgnify:FL=1
MHKMYEYLKNHAYISYNKKSTYQFELSEERAQCIANKYDSLTDELQQENKQLKMIVNEYERLNKGFKITNVQEYNIDELLSYKKYKDNWNYIKKMLKEAKQEKFNVNGYCGTCTDVDIDFLLKKMQELEQGSHSNE